MKFKLEIEMDNAAFEDDWRVEVERILHDVSNKIFNQDMPNPLKIRDVNGNLVGKVWIQR